MEYWYKLLVILLFSLENTLNFGTSMSPNFFFIVEKKEHDEIYL